MPTKPTKPVTFRYDEDRLALLGLIASSRGTDIANLLKQIVDGFFKTVDLDAVRDKLMEKHQTDMAELERLRASQPQS